MESAQLKEQILKAIYRQIGQQPTRNADLRRVLIDFDRIGKERLFDEIQELINDGKLVDQGHGYVAFTPDGWDVAEVLVNPPPTVNQNVLNVGHAHNSPIQQGIHSSQTQSTTYNLPSLGDLNQLVKLMDEHLAELDLLPATERKAKAQIDTIKAQLSDVPNPVIVNEAGRSLRNITEGAIGSLLATAATQPDSVWTVIQSLLSFFS